MQGSMEVGEAPEGAGPRQYRRAEVEGCSSGVHQRRRVSQQKVSRRLKSASPHQRFGNTPWGWDKPCVIGLGFDASERANVTLLG